MPTMAPARRRSPTLTLGDALRAERDRRGDSRPLAQDIAAQELGVSQPVFSEWERDKSEPKGENLEPLARWLGVTTEEVFVMVGWSKIARAEAELAETTRRLKRQRGR